MIRVVGANGDVLWSEMTALDSFPEHLDIRLREVRPHAAEDTVSAARLTHRVPRKALRAFRDAAKAKKKGDSASAIAMLEDALRIDPSSALAQCNLGVAWMALNCPQEAEQAARAALRFASLAKQREGLGLALTWK